jgi:hypothetical protein
LRKAQRINGAIERKKTYSEIMKASKEDSKLFYKLVNKQRCTTTNATSEISYNDENFNTPSQICDGFYKYFRDLAIPKDDPLFDTEHKNNVEFDYLLIEEITQNEQIESEKFIITIKDVENATNGLNKRQITGHIRDHCRTYSVRRRHHSSVYIQYL